MSAPPPPPSPDSRYRPDAPPDYSHRFHAGNIGDVWKHCCLAEILRRAAAAARGVAYLESHAGEGRYPLGPTGEWTEAIGRLWTVDEEMVAGDAAGGGVVSRYVTLCRRSVPGSGAPEVYPGSPAIARSVLGPDARLTLFERDLAVAARLAALFAGDAAARVVPGDGLAALADEVRTLEAGGAGAHGTGAHGKGAGARGTGAHGTGASGSGAGRDAQAVVALIDPPYTQKADWNLVADALAAAVRASTRACLVLWYPVKSLTRPNAMRARLAAAGVTATALELVTTPLDHKRRRLNGSGVLVVRPPAGAIAALAAAAPVLGRRCATRDGTWSLQVAAWQGRGAATSSST